MDPNMRTSGTMRAWLAIPFVLLGAACSSSNSAPTGADAGTPGDGSKAPDALADSWTGDAPMVTDAPGADTGTPPDGGASGPTIAGCPLFPASYPYNVDVSQAPLDPGSATYIANLKARTGVIDAPIGTSEYINIVPSSQPMVAVQFTSGGRAYGFDPTDTFYNSATGSAPIPASVVYENMTTPNADHHMIVVQQGTCRLFEMYAWNPSGPTSGWEALVTWNLTKNEQLPDGWGSTTAAGTPILPGVIQYDEVMAGEIKHAVDIVIPGADLAAFEYVKPAARSAGACGSPYPMDGFPYGGRLRLKASYDTSAFTGTQALVIVRALQKYGMINTDDSGYSRSDFRVGPGTWNMADLAQIKLTWDDFEVPMMTPVQSKACN